MFTFFSFEQFAVEWQYPDCHHGAVPAYPTQGQDPGPSRWQVDCRIASAVVTKEWRTWSEWGSKEAASTKVDWGRAKKSYAAQRTPVTA